MPRIRRLGPFLRAGLALALVASTVPRAAAQTVMEVQGGGSSLLGGYGATANFWRSNVDGWIGIGYLNGLRLGAFLRTQVKKDTLRIGNDALAVRFPTDVFGSGSNLLVQGVSVAGTRGGRTSYLAFTGAGSGGLGGPSFQATDIGQPLGALFLEHRVSPTVRLTGAALVAGQQTVVPGIEWRPTPDVTAALAAGVGSDRPFAASSVVLRRGPLGLKAAYAWSADGYRRIAVPTPSQTEVDRENLVVTYDVAPDFQVGVSRQHFVQDSSDAAPPLRASGNSAFAGGRWHQLRLTAGLYDSRSAGTRNLSSYVALGRELRSWLDAELFLLQSRPAGRPVATTPVANLRWQLSPHVSLMQQVSLHAGEPTILLGAGLLTALGEFRADYQIVHQPFQPFNPFRSTLNLTARVQLGRYSTSVGTYLQPDGGVEYSASGSTFVYMGAFGGVQPQTIGAGLARYVVRGTVRDEAGAPVEGAALEVGGEVAFTDSRGAFFVRVPRPRRYPLVVSLNEFLLPGRWEMVSAPSEVEGRTEATAAAVTIVLRHPGAPPPPPSPAATGVGPPDIPDSIDAAALPPAPVRSDTLRLPPIDSPGELLPDTPALGAAPRPALFTDERTVARLTGVNFEPGRAVMLPGSLAVLDSIARDLLALPGLRVEVAGHTDSVGSRRQNLALSRARAEAVQLYLGRRGVPMGSMRPRGYGPDRPLADNRTPEGRAENRRVELRRLGAASGPVRITRPAAQMSGRSRANRRAKVDR